MEAEKEIIRVAKSLISVGVARTAGGDVYGYVQIGQAEAMLDLLWKGMEGEEALDD